MEQRLAFVKLEVCGIQKFLCSTGKLKEMLGGSEIIDSLPEGFLNDRREELSLKKVERPEQGRDWYIEIQRGGRHRLSHHGRPCNGGCIFDAFFRRGA